MFHLLTLVENARENFLEKKQANISSPSIVSFLPQKKKKKQKKKKEREKYLVSLKCSGDSI